jgi:hypothetical protein
MGAGAVISGVLGGATGQTHATLGGSGVATGNFATIGSNVMSGLLGAAGTYVVGGAGLVLGGPPGAAFGGFVGGFVGAWVGTKVGAAFGNVFDSSGARCFHSFTSIALLNGRAANISSIVVGDTVLAFDPDAGPHGALVPRRVTRLYRNVTEEWITVTFDDEQLEPLTATPGHEMLCPDGQFRMLGDMVAKDGTVRLVAADGRTVTGRAERIVYSEETAHLYEVATVIRAATHGALALAPQPVTGWATYNFEVEELHTYVAGRGRLRPPVSSFH